MTTHDHNTALEQISPLMQQVTWQGQHYYTSQYFHAQYRRSLEDRGEQGKYRRHSDFLRRIQDIDSYPIYVERGDIVELAWPFSSRDSGKNTNADSAFVLEIKKLQSLFTKNGYHALTLLNAAAQLELTHHLDDELSKEMAYTHSKTARRHHQYFTDEMREKALRQRQSQVLSLLRLCEDRDKDLFRDLIDRHDRRVGLTIEVRERMNLRRRRIDVQQLILFESQEEAV